MSDVLSAASLFLAVIGLLYSVWYAEIREAIEVNVPPHKEDRGPAIKKTRRTYSTRALPLAVVSLTLAVVLAPELISVAVSTATIIAQERVSALRRYDVVWSLFCAVAITSIGLAIHTSRLAWRTRSRWKGMEE